MKKTILFSIFILCCSSTLLHAQVPGGIMFQAVARDINGNIASERNIHIKVNIQTDNNSNTSVYSEIFEVISSKEGIFSVVIGNGNWLSGANSIIDLDWNNNIYYLNLNVAVEPSLYDPSWNYQDKYVDLGTSQIWSVPYSFNAETANNINGILSGENGGTGVNNEGKTISLDGNLSLVGDFNLTINTTADSNITLPTSGTLATISDVTSEILSVNSNLSTIQEEIDNTQLGAGLQNDGSYVPNTSANYINTATNLSNATEILDNQISLNTSLIQNINNQKLNLTGGVMSGTLDMGSNSITNIASPINNQDAANKSYVDTAVTQIDITKLEIGLEKGKFFIGDSSNLAQGINLTGDISTNISGVVTISNDAVNSTKILDGTITSSDIANESIVDNSLATISTAGKVANSATSATKNNSPDTIVLRDENGNFSAGIITADVIGNSSSASKFESPITIAGQSFDGTANIEIEPSDLTGVTVLASEINYLTGTTSNIQNQLDGKAENNDLNSLVDRVTLNESAITSNTLNIAANTTSITTNTSDITTLQSEVNATQTGAGLGTDGTYTANGSTNYIASSTSIVDATEDLDTQIKTNEDGITSNATNIAAFDSRITTNSTDILSNASGIASNALNVTANTTNITANTSDIGTNTTDITTLQSEVNATQTGAGLGTDGTYSANGSTNYIASSTSIVDATENLDTQIKTNTDAIASNAGDNTNLQSELDATQTGAGLGTDGTYTADSSSNYLTTVTSLTGADTALDTQLKSVADEVASLSTSSSSGTASIQSELDATQTGAGLGTDGTYTADSSSNYITSVTSLAAADSALDAQIKNNTDALSNVSVNDATTTSKGIVKLAGDLGGTADLPTVPGLANKEDTANKSTTTSLGTSDVLFPTQNAVKTYVDNQIASGTVADATTSIKGIVKLAGDLSGTADLPTVPSLGLKENISHKSASTALGNSDVLYPTQKAVKTYVDQQLTVFDATSIVKGKIKLAGDLGGTADLPTVPGLSSKEDTSNKSTTTTLGNSDVLYPTQNAVKTYVDTQIATESVADATTTTKGVLMLSGDLSGTADSPTVPDLILKENASLKSSNVDLGSSDVLYPTQNAVKTYVDSQISSLSSASDASSTVKGILKLTGDLGGTADLPTVPGLANKEDAANKSTTTSLGTSDDLFPTQNAVKTYVDTQITSSLSLDATSSVKGILKLTGDLSGTADTPTVPGLLLKAPIDNPNLTGVPTAPTADSGTNTTQIATTAFVADAVTGVAASGVFVDLTSDQTVGGEKTFTSDISISATLTAGGTALPSSTGNAGQVLMISSSGVAQWTTIIQEINVEVSATASQTSFTLSQVPSDRSTIKMYINGVRVSNSAYSLSSLTVTYNPANNGSYTIMSGDRIQFDYYY